MLAWAEEDGRVEHRNHSSWSRKRQANPSPTRSGSPTKKSFGKRGGVKFANGFWNGADNQIFTNGNGQGSGSWMGSSMRSPPTSPLKTTENKHAFPSRGPEQAQTETEIAKSLAGKTLSSIYQSSDHPTLFLHFNDGTAYQVMVAGYDPNTHGPSPSPTSLSTPQPGLGPGAIQKKLELGPFFESLTQPGQTTLVDLKVTSAALIRLADKAFERRSSFCPPPPSPRKLSRKLTSTSSTTSESVSSEDQEMADRTPTPPTPLTPTYQEQKWNQHHMSLALKFEGVEGWQCISASMQSRGTALSNTSTPTLSNWTFNNSSSSLNLNSPTLLSPLADVNGEIFSSYEDVYLKPVQNQNQNQNQNRFDSVPNTKTNGSSSPKKKHARQNSEWSEWSFSSGGT